MSDGPDVPERVAVSSPRTRAIRVRHGWPVSRDIDEQTELGVVYMRSLIRGQFRLALLTCLIVGCVLVGLPLLFALSPGLAQVRVSGVRLPWIVLGGCVQPLWVATAWWHVRRAERNERAFASLVERS